MEFTLVRITRHCTERFAERFPSDAKNLSFEEIRKMCREQVMAGDDNRSVFNNTKFITNIWERYGYDIKYRFIISGKYLFICGECINDNEENQNRTVLKVFTVVPSAEHVAAANKIQKYGNKKQVVSDDWDKRHAASVLTCNISPYTVPII